MPPQMTATRSGFLLHDFPPEKSVNEKNLLIDGLDHSKIKLYSFCFFCCIFCSGSEQSINQATHNFKPFSLMF